MKEEHGRRAVFLDLNGTLVLPIEVTSPGQYQPIPHAADGVRLLCRAGFLCPVVTVQSRVGKGLFTEREFRAWFGSFREALASQGAVLEGPYVCPHRYRTPCGCKKPTGLLYRQAAADLGVDLASSFVVGDSIEDMKAGGLLGCCRVAVRTGWRMGSEVQECCDHVADDLLAAAQWIVASAARRTRSTVTSACPPETIVARCSPSGWVHTPAEEKQP